jgi:hypothetical protein
VFVIKRAQAYLSANYADDLRLAKLVGLASLVAIAIAAFGIYVLATYSVQRMARQIVLRKLYGAGHAPSSGWSAASSRACWRSARRSRCRWPRWSTRATWPASPNARRWAPGHCSPPCCWRRWWRRCRHCAIRWGRCAWRLRKCCATDAVRW